MEPWDSLNHTIIHCRQCPRLVAWREQVAIVRKRAYREQEYWGKPVPGFGDHNARVLVVGLAPVPTELIGRENVYRRWLRRISISGTLPGGFCQPAAGACAGG